MGPAEAGGSPRGGGPQADGEAPAGSAGAVAQPARNTCTLVWSPVPREVLRRSVTLDGAATARRVLEALQCDPVVAALVPAEWQPGCWGRRTGWDDELPPDARVELYRALKVDPKEARRQRFQAQGPVGRFRRRTLER